MFIITEMTNQNISQKKYYSGTLTAAELNSALQSCYYDTKLHYTYNKEHELYDIGDFVFDYLTRTDKNIEQLLRYIIYLDPEFISIINELHRNNLFGSWAYVNQLRKDNIIIRTNLSENSSSLFEFYKTLEQLENYMSSNYYSKLKNYRNKATIAYFFTQDYQQSIKYNKKILRINGLDKDALFYLGASYIATFQIDIGVKYLQKLLKFYPNQEQFIKSNIKNEEAIKMIFHK